MADVLHRTQVDCRVADDPWTVDEHHRIREEVFVREQGLFQGSDRDGRDEDAATIKVLGFRDEVAGGAVRLYPLDDADHWQGDRLAVLPGTRGHGLGAPLVWFAVATAARGGGRLMTAHIQPRNVAFFERLGWRVSGEQEIYVGVPHIPMAIDLTSGRSRTFRGWIAEADSSLARTQEEGAAVAAATTRTQSAADLAAETPR